MLELLRRFPRILSFCSLTLLFAGFGQTYVLAYFIPHVGAQLGLSATEVGGFFAVATILGALSFPFIGILLQQLEWVKYTMLATVLFATGFYLLVVNKFLSVLVICFFLIRIAGQGFFNFLGRDTANREFGAARGRALSLTSLGNLPAEMFFPWITVRTVEVFGWKWAAAEIGMILIGLYLPIAITLLRQAEVRELPLLRRTFSGSGAPGVGGRTLWKKRASGPGVFRDLALYPLLFCNAVQPFVLTGLFYYQPQMAKEKGWTLSWIAGSFAAFAVARAASTTVVGYLVDRWSAKKLYPGYVIPLSLSLVVLLMTNSLWSAPVFLAFAGVAVGASGTIILSLWAERYGLRELARAHGTGTAVSVIATALAPPIVGWWIDHGLGIHTILTTCLVFTLAGGVAGGIGVRMRLPRGFRSISS